MKNKEKLRSNDSGKNNSISVPNNFDKNNPSGVISTHILNVYSDLKIRNREMGKILHEERIKRVNCELNLIILTQIMSQGRNIALFDKFTHLSNKSAVGHQQKILQTNEFTNQYQNGSVYETGNTSVNATDETQWLDLISPVVAVNSLIDTNNRLIILIENILGQYLLLKLKMKAKTCETNITLKQFKKRSISVGFNRPEKIRFQCKKKTNFPSLNVAKLYLKSLHQDFNAMIDELIAKIVSQNVPIHDYLKEKRYSQRDYVLKRSLSLI